MTRYFVYFFFVLSAAFLATGCSKDTDNDGEEVVPFFEVTCPQLDNIAWEGTVFTLSVESNAEWSVVSNAGWCKVTDNVSGNANADVTIEISDNLTGESREAIIQFTWGVEGEKNEIKVVQAPQPFEEGGLYKIPVVFQMLYGNRNIETQYVKEGHLHARNQELIYHYIMRKSRKETNYYEKVMFMAACYGAFCCCPYRLRLKKCR